MNEDGLILNAEQSPPRNLGAALWRCALALLLYAALWGCLCSLGALSWRGILPLLPGAAASGLLPLLPKRVRRWALPVCAGLALGGIALLGSRFFGGCGLFLNRLFAASEARQRYLYEKFTVPGVTTDDMLRALLPLGLLSAPLCAAAHSRWPGCVLFTGLLGLMVWLGLLPAAPWLLLLAAAAVLPFLTLRADAAALCLAALGLAATVFLLFGGTQEGLARWAETARDTLAPQTVAYADAANAFRSEPDTQPPQTQNPPESAQEATDTEPNRHALWTVLAILLAMLLLFVPSIWSDRLRRRRERLRAGLDDADNAACVRATFLYALRWLRLGGLKLENRPYSEMTGRLAAAYPALAEPFAAVIPLWQRAAYSEAPCTADDRANMQAFLQEAICTAKETMSGLTCLKSRFVL